MLRRSVTEMTPRDPRATAQSSTSAPDKAEDRGEVQRSTRGPRWDRGMTGDRPGSEAWQGATKRPRGYSNATTSTDGQQMTRLATAVETYFEDLRRVRASGGATGERSSYGPLANLLNAVGGALKPKVFCVIEMADQGAGHPDLGLYAARQVQRGQPREGQIPECGVVEVKPADDDAWLTAASDQVSRYWGRYRLVLVTNTRDFVLLGEDAEGRPAKLETFRLAAGAEEFDRLLEKPRVLARRVGAGLGEYLLRALSHRAALVEPRDLAWLLASYARDGLARVEASGDAPSLAAVRGALEEALGVRFEGERGAAFFRSTLVQTLFYGVFSAWVLWARQTPPPTGRFNWHEAVWHLRAPVAAGAVPAALRSRTLATPGPGRGAGLDQCRTRPRGPGRLLRPLQRGRGRALLLRAVPASLRSGAAQAAGRLVHARRGGALHGGAGGPRAAGRPGHRRRAGGGERLRAGPLLRHRRLPGRNAAPHRRQPARSRPGRADRRARQTGRRWSGCSASRSCPRRSWWRTCKSG